MNLSDTDQATYSASAPQTATVSDEAVRAASIAVNIGHRDFEIPQRVLKLALTAALPHLALTAAPCSVEVKKLEWHNVDAYCAWCYADTEFGQYRVSWSFNESGQKLHFPDGTTKQLNEKGYGDRDAAKAAAQADFERRILSQIVTKPVDQENKDFEAIGRSYMAAFETITTEGTEWDDYTPAECPSELLLDIFAAQQERNPVDVIALAKSMLSIWDQWMNVENIDKATEKQATNLLKAACFAGQAYEDMIASPLTADAAPSALLRIFLTAIIDANSAELNPYRAKNRVHSDAPTSARTQLINVEAMREENTDLRAALQSIADLSATDMTLGDQVFAVTSARSAIRTLSPAEPVDQLPQSVVDLVIAGRELVYSDEIRTGGELSTALDKALEAFASRVPWENEPDSQDKKPTTIYCTHCNDTKDMKLPDNEFLSACPECSPTSKGGA